MVRTHERHRPLCQEARELARVFVVARPLEGTLAAPQMYVGVRVRPTNELPAQPLERLGSMLAAVYARRPEEDDGVLNVFALEASERLQILGEDAERPRLFAVEKRRVEIRQWLGGRIHQASDTLQFEKVRTVMIEL